MSDLKTIFVDLQQLQTPNREVTKLRFAPKGSPAVEGEVEVTIMYEMCSEVRQLGMHNERGIAPMLLSAHTEIDDECFDCLENPPEVQEDGYCYLTNTHLLFLCGVLANKTLQRFNLLAELNHIARNVGAISISMDTVPIPGVNICPIYVNYLVPDADIEKAIQYAPTTLVGLPIQAPKVG